MIRRTLALSVLFLFLIFGCRPEYEELKLNTNDYVLSDQLSLELVAAEPLIEAPVDISFDDAGRMWVLEMRGYMRTVAGTGEEDPVGRIVILEDKDNDGVADHERVFLDNLKLARAMGHVYGGLLYAEPPNLWFIDINTDLTPGNKVLVDSAYVEAGNVEHQPNGLMMNIDNWIYSARSDKRYRRVKGKWIVDYVSPRGQWGLTHDQFGRLLFNDNSNQLRGDDVLPGLVEKYTGRSHVLNQQVVKNQRVYPLQAVPVNRGYIDGVLDEDDKLINVTSACGPVFYHGSGLPGEYNGAAFVCLPEANLIKWNNIVEQPFSLTGEQALKNEEFLASYDMGFRPVNMKNGPDGALYIVDMHRGIIQHKTFMTSYLREEILKRGLDSLTGMGRILRVAEKDGGYYPMGLADQQPDRLLSNLNDSNVWIRMRSQQLLIQTGQKDHEEDLMMILNDAREEYVKIHALYTLEGLGLLQGKSFNLKDFEGFRMLQSHFVKLAILGIVELNVQPDVAADSLSDYYLTIMAANRGDAESVNEYVRRNQESDWIREPVIATFKGDTSELESAVIRSRIRINTERLAARSANQNQVEYRGLTPGLTLYRKNCAVCHGPDGEGLDQLAPPLLESEYVSGDPKRLAAILIYGLSGPITVAGKDYEFNAAMPGLKDNTDLSDDDIRYILNFVRNAFGTAPIVPPGDLIKETRDLNREGSFTVEELNETFQ